MYKYQRLYFNNKLIMKSFLSFASRIPMFNFFNIGHSSIYPNLVFKSKLDSLNYYEMTNGDLIDVLAIETMFTMSSAENLASVAQVFC